LGFATWGLMGMIWTIRSEIPQPIPIRGVLAKILGGVMTIICFGLAAGMLGITLIYLFGGSI
jgi:hypothetical protein